MSSCCSPRGYRRIFSVRTAEREARRYRRRGLDRTSRQIADLLLSRGVEGCTMLEVGGGAGTLQVELLRAGAASALNVELTPTYEKEAQGLLRQFGLADRVERRLADFTEVGAGISPADMVVLNRVVCCYPDMPRLAGAAADRTRGILVLSFPKVTWWTRALLGMGNALLRLLRWEFQIFLHRPELIQRSVERHGLHPATRRTGRFWQVMAFDGPGRAGSSATPGSPVERASTTREGLSSSRECSVGQPNVGVE